MLDTQCVQAEKRAEENAQMAMAMLNAIPGQFKSSHKVKQSQIRLLKKQIAYNLKKGNSDKANSLMMKLNRILTKTKN